MSTYTGNLTSHTPLEFLEDGCGHMLMTRHIKMIISLDIVLSNRDHRVATVDKFTEQIDKT